MKKYTQAILLLLVGIGLGFCLSTVRDDASAQYMNGNNPGQSTDSVASPMMNMYEGTGRTPARIARPLEVPPLYAFDTKIDDTCQQITLVDSETKRICVYWIKQKANSSTIRLVASKTFEWDLKLDDFNVEGLSSQQIRDQVERGTP